MRPVPLFHDKPLVSLRRQTPYPSDWLLRKLDRFSPLRWPRTIPRFWSKNGSGHSYSLVLASDSSPSSRPVSPTTRRARRKSISLNFEDDVTTLSLSLNPLDSVRALRHRRWRTTDLQYPLLAALLFFSLFITPPAPLIKTIVLLGTGLLMLVPLTGQFLLPSMPIWAYLFFFFSSRFIPVEYRPPISVNVLPALEHYLIHGTSIASILSAHNHPVLDLLAWVPYGIGHFAAPAVCSLLLFLFAAPGATPSFARTFGWLSALGVALQILLPTTPPWYEMAHGSQPARYGMPGDAAGLARIDKLFGTDIYTSNFAAAPVPFGAFPSLHGADAVLEALFIGRYFPILRIPAGLYVVWIFWATMYLAHHYAVDLIGGGAMAITFFLVMDRYWLPRPQHDKLTRWDYQQVELGRRTKVTDEEEQQLDVDGETEVDPFLLQHQEQQQQQSRRPPLAGLKQLQIIRVSGSADDWAAGGVSAGSSSSAASSKAPSSLWSRDGSTSSISGSFSPPPPLSDEEVGKDFGFAPGRRSYGEHRGMRMSSSIEMQEVTVEAGR